MDLYAHRAFLELLRRSTLYLRLFYKNGEATPVNIVFLVASLLVRLMISYPRGGPLRAQGVTVEKISVLYKTARHQLWASYL